MRRSMRPPMPREERQPHSGSAGPRRASALALFLILALAFLSACGSPAPRAKTPTATPIPTIAASKGDGRPPLALAADVTSCAAVKDFASAGAASAGASFADVPFPPNSQSVNGAASDNLYHFQVVDVCTTGANAAAVLTFFAARMVAAGWAQSATYPYAGDVAHVCGDPYCWRKAPKDPTNPKDLARYASLERMSAAASGAVSAYTIRLATAPTPRAQIAIHTASGAARSGGSALAVSASCGGGEQMLGGGFYLSSSDHTYSGRSSYPSGPATWMVTAGGAGGASPFELQAYAVCLGANFSLGAKIIAVPFDVASGGSKSETAACPAGSVVTGGGLQIAAGPGIAAGSAPTSALDGWTAAAAASGGAVHAVAYALCAARSLAPGVAISRAFTLYTDNDLQLSLGCNTGQWLTGGGYSNNDPTGDGRNVYALDGPTADDSRWFVQGHNLDPNGAHGAHIWVVCLAPVPYF